MRLAKCLICVFLSLFLSDSILAQSRLTLAIRKVSPHILKVYTYDQNHAKIGQGSGLIVNVDGTCITNYHVLSACDFAEVVTSKGVIYNIESIIDYNQETDLIKFKIKPKAPLPITTSLTLSSVNQEIGNDVFAIGYPNSFESNNTYTVSTGIISGFRTENGNKYIQSSTPITHGSSGGGLFNYNGQLIGITQGTFAEEIKDRHANLNKVVPVNFLKELNQNKKLSFPQFNKNIFNSDILVQAYYYYDKADFRTAIPLLLQYLDRFPEDPFVWYRYGTSLLYLNDIHDKEKHFEFTSNALEYSTHLDPTNFYAWANLCLAKLHQGDRNAAYNAINKAYDIAPNSPKVLGIFGQYYSYNKQYAKAVPFFTVAITNSKETTGDKSTAKIFLERAISNAWLNNDKQANSDYLSSLKIDPSNEETYWWYINFLGTRKRWSEACNYSRVLKSMNPNFKYGQSTIDKMINYSCNR